MAEIKHENWMGMVKELTAGQPTLESLIDRQVQTKENELYLQSDEWKNFEKEARNAVSKDYTVIFRNQSGELEEAWHFTNEMNFDYLKKKYRKQGKEIVRIREKTMAYGEYIKTIYGKREE